MVCPMVERSHRTYTPIFRLRSGIVPSSSGRLLVIKFTIYFASVQYYAHVPKAMVRQAQAPTQGI